jgi:hypothetical protein
VKKLAAFGYVVGVSVPWKFDFNFLKEFKIDQSIKVKLFRCLTND